MITWTVLVSSLLLLVSRCERVSSPRSWVVELELTRGGDCLGLRAHPASCPTSQIPSQTALMACPPVCEPRASGPAMTDYTPWHLVTLVKWLGSS